MASGSTMAAVNVADFTDNFVTSFLTEISKN